MKEAVEIMSPHKTQELIWASPRELLNIFHADEVGCHVITVTHDILKKLSLVGKGLDEYSLDTVKMFVLRRCFKGRLSVVIRILMSAVS